MSGWDRLNPEVGSTAALESSTDRLSDVRSRLYDAEVGARAARELASHQAWTGGGGTSWRIDTRSVEAELTPPRTTITNAIGAINAYIDELEAIKTATASEKQKLGDAQAVLWRFNGIDLNPIDNGVELVRKANAMREISEAQFAIWQLGDRRQTADDALVQALRSAVPESWSEVRAAFEAVGLTSASDLTAQEIAEAMATLSLSITDRNGGSARQDLLRFLEIYGNDPEVMSAYFRRLGGANTVALIDELGDSYGYTYGNDTDALELAQRLRAGLSIASQTWSESTAATFADQMFNAQPDSDVDAGWFEPGRVSGIAYLFADSANHPMSRALTIAVASQVDVWEREHGGLDIGYGAPGTMGEPGMGATSLFGADAPHGAELFVAAQQTSDPDRFWWSNIDMAGQVFETLGLYPQDAFDFLTADDARVEYWFGDRDWSVDGHEGIAALWSGAQQVPGGPFGPEYDAQVGEQVAELASMAIWELTGNEHFLTEHITELASGSFATALALHLDLIADMMLRYDGYDPNGAGVTDGTHPFASDEQRFAPVLSDDVLAKFLSEVGSHDVGAAVIHETIVQYQELYLAGGMGDPALLGEALDRATWLQGALDGSGITGRIEAAERYDAQVDAAIDAFKKVIDLIPVPAASKILTGAGIVLDKGAEWLLGKLQSELVSSGKGALFSAWKDSLHQTAQVTAEMTDHAQAQTTFVTLSTAEFLSAALGEDVVGEIPAIGADEDPDAFAQRVAEWWGDTLVPGLMGDERLDGYALDQLLRKYEDSLSANAYRAQG